MGSVSRPAAAARVRGEAVDRRALGHLPTRHRLPLLTWIGVYPVLTALTYAAEPLLSGAPTARRTLFVSAVVVPAMVYLIMPFMRHRYCSGG